jgi:hypothetical protein
MITIHVLEMNVNYFMYTATGNDFNFEFKGGEITLT